MNADALLEADEAAPVNDLELLDAIWPALCDAIAAHDDPPTGVVGDWFWSRLSLEEIQSAGLAELQSAPPEELPEMTEAWQRLGRADMVDLLFAALTAPPARLDALEDRLDDLADGLDDLHVRLLRAHRAAFLATLRRPGSVIAPR
jgi:hypothetical protein